MPFERPTLQQLSDRIQSDFQTRVDDAKSLLRRSILRIKGRVYAGAVHGLYGFLSYMKDQLFASSADVENLETHGSEFGITRKAATKATGEVEGTGTAGAWVYIGEQLEAPDGQLYEVTADSQCDGAGDISIPVEAVIAGVEGNQSVGVILSFVSPIVDIDTITTVDSNALTGGLDEEDDEDLRDRVLLRKRQPPHGGADFDYEAWALEVSGVTRAWSFPQYMGVGTIGLAFVRDNDTSTIIPNDTQKEEVRAYMIDHVDPLTGLTVGIPITAEPGFIMVDLSLLSQNFTIEIYPNSTTVQNNVRQQLQDLINSDGGPGEIVYYSSMTAAINQAAGLIAHRITSPEEDIGVPVNKVLQLGDISFEDYS